LYALFRDILKVLKQMREKRRKSQHTPAAVREDPIAFASSDVFHHTYANTVEAVAAMLEWFAAFSLKLASLAAVTVERYDVCGQMTDMPPAGGVLIVWVRNQQAAVATFIRVDPSRTILTITETLVSLIDGHDKPR
jgi:hypothetical protein